jgi:hypothetical protein
MEFSKVELTVHGNTLWILVQYMAGNALLMWSIEWQVIVCSQLTWVGNMPFQWIFPAKVEGILCTHSSWLCVPYQVPNIQCSVDEFELGPLQKMHLLNGFYRETQWLDLYQLWKRTVSLKCFVYNKVIC